MMIDIPYPLPNLLLQLASCLSEHLPIRLPPLFCSPLPSLDIHISSLEEDGSTRHGIEELVVLSSHRL